MSDGVFVSVCVLGVSGKQVPICQKDARFMRSGKILERFILFLSLCLYLSLEWGRQGRRGNVPLTSGAVTLVLPPSNPPLPSGG